MAAYATPIRLTTGHVGLNVTDLDVSLAFYGSVLGLELQGRGESQGRSWAFLGRGEELLVTLWQQSAGRFDPKAPGLHHLSFEVGTIEVLIALQGAVSALGLPVEYGGVVSHGSGEDSGGLFFSDPDGIRLEVYTESGGGALRAPHADVPTCGFF